MPIKFELRQTRSRNQIILQPFIPINLVNPATGQSVDIDALIDSGASKNLFPEKIAKLIGINDITDSEVGRGEEFGSASGMKIKAYPHRVLIEIGKRHNLETVIYFSKNIPQESCLLGMHGFFNHFEVKISVRKQTIELQPY